jgi:hypothetical protein
MELTSIWADEQAMLLHPTFNIWFKDMPKQMLTVGEC